MIRSNFDMAKKKGEIGETIVKALIEAKGYSVYQPTTQGAHQFDMLCIKDKKMAIALDVKTKARMNHYPATGVNEQHFMEYKAFSEKHNMPFYIVFVDEGDGRIYGNSLEELEKPQTIDGVSYPHIITNKWGKKIRIWPLCNMSEIATLDGDDAERLVKLSQRNHEYMPMEAAP